MQHLTASTSFEKSQRVVMTRSEMNFMMLEKPIVFMLLAKSRCWLGGVVVGKERTNAGKRR